jgi:Rps23 Pro-64 3,4-dihydroxylase Tpa1-like proline 4-hydroxylase
LIGNWLAVFNKQARFRVTQVVGVELPVDIQRLAKLGWPIRPMLARNFPAPGGYFLDPFRGKNCPDQDCGWESLSLYYEVKHPVHAVSKVYVAKARRTIHDPGALGAPVAAVTAQVFFSPVGFSLDDQPGKTFARLQAHQAGA